MADDPNELEVSEQLEPQITALTQYWTAQALSEATPIDVAFGEDAIQPQVAEALWQPEGELLANMPVFPDGQSTTAYDPQPECPPSGPNTERVPNRTIIPYSPVGKLFMTFDGADYVGTAWVIAERGIVTAGHCVHNSQRGGFADNLLFVPQYHLGAEPRGRWSGIQTATLSGWSNGGSDRFRYDLAAIKLDRPIAPYTGSLGWIANAPPHEGCITGIGYPSGHPFDGQEMWRSTGKSIPDPVYQRMFNDMTPGCSGGPWEIWREGVPVTKGINSFRYTQGAQNEMYSPHFGAGFLNLWNWVR